MSLKVKCGRNYQSSSRNFSKKVRPSDSCFSQVSRFDYDHIAECPSFIDTLFTVLRTKSYLPYATSSTPIFPTTTPSVDTGIPIPLDGLISPSIPTQSERTRKRSIEHDEHDGRPPSKGPRLSGDGQSRYMNGRGDGRSWQGRGDGFGSEGHVGAGMMGPGMGMDMDGTGSMAYMNGRRSQAYRPPDLRRGICRDYHSKHMVVSTRFSGSLV